MGTVLSRLGLSTILRDMPRVPTRLMEEESEQLRAQGREVLKLIPMPDVELPGHIIEAAQAAAAEPQLVYPIGLPELRQGIAARLHEEMGIEIDPETEILVTYGANHALFLAISTILNEGEEVLLPIPGYFIDGIVVMAKGRLNCALMSEAEEYRLDVQKLEKSISAKTRVIYLVSPQNPTGHVITEDELQAVADLAERHNLFVLSDESYERMVYDGRRVLSPICLPQMRERTILIRSFTKSYLMPEWRVGYIVAPATLIEQVVKLMEWMCLYGSYVSQKAAAAAVWGPQEWTRLATLKMQEDRDMFYEGICETEGLSAVKPQGGPFFFINISALGIEEEEFRVKLLREYGIPTLAGKDLKETGHLRLRYGGKPDALRKTMDGLKQAAMEVGLHRVRRA